MRSVFLFLIFVGLAVLVYFPSLHGTWIMDDSGYLARNSLVTGSNSPWVFWSRFDQPDYWPLTYTAYWVLYRLFGEDHFGYHACNVLLHAANALLVYGLARRTVPASALFAALVFLLHPLNVQAVAWIVQLKTLLATSFALLSLTLYVEYLRADRLQDWAWALALFVLGLLTKTSIVALPLILLLLPGWTGKLGRIRNITSVLPFLFVSLIAGGTTLLMNAAGDSGALARESLARITPETVLLVARNLVFYMAKFLVPQPLAFLYPLATPGGHDVNTWLAFVVLGLMALALTSASLARVRGPLFAYVAALLPALGFVAVPGMKLAPVSDHWAYFANAFICLAIAAWWDQLALGASFARGRYLVLPLLGALTFRHAGTFADERQFWAQAERVSPRSAIPVYNLGVAYDATEPRVASRYYERAVTLDPSHARAWYNLGRMRALFGEFTGAEEALKRSLELDRHQPGAYLTLARVWAAEGQREAARGLLEAGWRENPGDETIKNELAKFPRAQK